MLEIPELDPLLPALRDLLAWLGAQGVPAMVIGGLAASVLGRPRLTRDVDVVILLEQGRWKEFLAAGAKCGFTPRLKDVLRFARKKRVFPLHHSKSGIDVDLVLGGLPFEAQAIARAVWKNVQGVKVPLPAPEDLIVMKAVAHRPRDLADIEAVLDAHPKLDRRRIRRWVGEFARAMEEPEVLRDLERLLARRRSSVKSAPSAD